MKTEIIEVTVGYGRTFNLGNFASKRIDLSETYQVTLETGEDSRDVEKFEKRIQKKLQETVENDMYED